MLGDHHPDTLNSLNNLGSLLVELDDNDALAQLMPALEHAGLLDEPPRPEPAPSDN